MQVLGQETYLAQELVQKNLLVCHWLLVYDVVLFDYTSVVPCQAFYLSFNIFVLLHMQRRLKSYNSKYKVFLVCIANVSLSPIIMDTNSTFLVTIDNLNCIKDFIYSLPHLHPKFGKANK